MPLVLSGTDGLSGVDGTASNPAIEGTDSNTGIFYPAADTVAIGTGGTEALRVNSSQNVGIGTSSPTAKLDVAGISQSSSASFPVFQLYNSGLASNAYFRIAYDAANNLVFNNVNNAYTSSTEFMRITSSGNVGIGTSSPGAKLDVVGDLKLNGFSVYSGSASLGANMFAGTAFNTGGAAVAFRGTSSGFNNGGIEFYTGSGSTGTERARITSGGNFGVGTTIPGTNYGELVNFTSGTASQPSLTLLNTNASFSNDVFQLRCANTAANGNSWNMITGFSSTSTLNFLVRGSGNVQNTNNSYGAISDERLKENIVDATPKLENLKQVRVVNFNLIGDEQKQIGVVAQELEQIFPSMVEEDSGGMKAVKYSVFVPMLIKAIQELNAKVEALEAQLKGNA